MNIPLNEVLFFDAITSSSDGSAVDADSAPTFEVFEESTDAAIVSGTFTKRTSKTGDYRGTATLSTANGFEVGKWYSIIGTAIVSGITGKGVVKNFRVCAAETTVGVSNVLDGSGNAIAPASATTAISAAIAALNNLAAGAAMTLTTGERNAIAAALLDLTDGIESGKTPRQAIKLMAAALAGKRTNSGSANETFYAIGNTSTIRIVGNLDSAGDGVPTLTP